MICLEWKLKNSESMTLIGSVYEHGNQGEGVKSIIICKCGRNVSASTDIASEPSPKNMKALVVQQKTCKEAWDENFQFYTTE